MYLDDLKRNGCIALAGADIAQRLVPQLIPGTNRGPIPYSQSDRWDTPFASLPGVEPTGQRQDCSGAGSYAMGIYLDGPGSWGGKSTDSIVTSGAVYPIPVDKLDAGDAIGNMFPGSAGGGGGHMEIFTGVRVINGRYRVIGHGSGLGPWRRDILIGSYEAFRYAFKLDGDVSLRPSIDPERYVKFYNSATGTYVEWTLNTFGGPVRDFQTGYNKWAEAANVPALLVDGVLGQISFGAVKRFQAEHGLKVDGIIGPRTAAQLWPYVEPDDTPTPPVPPVGWTEADIRRIAREEAVHQSLLLATNISQGLLAYEQGPKS